MSIVNRGLPFLLFDFSLVAVVSRFGTSVPSVTMLSQIGGWGLLNFGEAIFHSSTEFATYVIINIENVTCI